MKNAHSRILSILKKVFLGLFLTIFLGIAGLFIGTIIGGNLASPGIDIYFHYAGTYGWEAGGILGAQIGLVLGVILSLYFSVKPLALPKGKV